MYKVRFFQDDEYEVVSITYPQTDTFTTTSPYDGRTELQVFKGSLSDCEAWIRLHEKGYME